jgi:hypothetical protein
MNKDRKLHPYFTIEECPKLHHSLSYLGINLKIVYQIIK